MTWLLIAWKWLSGLPKEVYFAIFSALMLWLAYSAAYHRGANAVQAEWDAERTANQLAADAQKAEAAAKEAKDAAAFALLADNLRKENERAKQDADRTIADLRRGAIRLRDRFTCKSTVPGPTTSAGGSDEASQGGLLRTDQEFLLHIGAEADGVARTLQACQDILSAERQ
jgi:hypothetical protein